MQTLTESNYSLEFSLMDDLAWPTFEMFFHAVNNEWQQMGLPEASTISSEV